MAKDARAIQPDEVGARLPVPTSRDELAELAVAFNELLDQLFAAYERQRRFAGDAAHQLRTPLTVLQGQVEVALRRVRTLEEYQSTLRVVNDEVAALSRTVEALLFLAQPSNEGKLPDLRMLSVSSWLNEYLPRWEKHARWPDFRVDVQPDIVCETSPGLLAQLLDVLLSNAVKYSQAGSPIQVRAQTAGGELRIEVEDAGMGIADDDLDAIFQPFFRAKQARQSGVPGTGLGLAIAARMATSLDGRLTCESQPGVGTRFRLTLPRAASGKASVAAIPYAATE
jgi:signal transduction histidine kinase